MLISYIITTWNRKATLEWHLRRLAMQSWDKPFEVIVCVDGSTDGTQKMLKYWDIGAHINGESRRGYNARYTMRWYDTQNIDKATPGWARNLGIQHANGEMIIFADDDCLPHNDLILEFAKHHRPMTVQVGLMVSSKEYLNQPVPIKIRDEDKPQRYRDWEQGRFRAGHFVTGCAAMPLSVAKTKAMDGSEGFDQRFVGYGCEDKEFAQRLALHGIAFTFTPTAVSWHLNPSATNQQDPGQKAADLEENRKRYQAIMDEQRV